jgi:alpha-galactosidase
MEIDYMTSGPRSFFITVNGGANSELDLNGSSFGLPVSTVVPVTLQAGANTIQFGNPTNYAPNLDRIAISQGIGSANLAGAIAAKQGSATVRIWQVSLTNAGSAAARHAEVNSFSLIQTGGTGTCYPKVLPPLPIQVGDIAPGAQRSIEIPIDFSKCSQNALFNTSLVFSSNNGADVSDITEESTTR